MAKPIEWLGSSLGDLRAFPDEARAESGFQLRMVQAGEPPLDWKPMRNIGHGVMEIRVHCGGEFRVMYVAKFREAIYVLHCFAKKTRATSHADVEKATRRYSELLALRHHREEA